MHILTIDLKLLMTYEKICEKIDNIIIDLCNNDPNNSRQLFNKRPVYN